MEMERLVDDVYKCDWMEQRTPSVGSAVALLRQGATGFLQGGSAYGGA